VPWGERWVTTRDRTHEGKGWKSPSTRVEVHRRPNNQTQDRTEPALLTNAQSLTRIRKRQKGATQGGTTGAV